MIISREEYEKLSNLIDAQRELIDALKQQMAILEKYNQAIEEQNQVLKDVLFAKKELDDAVGSDVETVKKELCKPKTPSTDRPSGEWIHSHEGTIAEGLYCSNCGKHGYGEKFCPNCKAKMKGADYVE